MKEFRVMYKSNGVAPKGNKSPVGKRGMHGRFFNVDGEDEEALAEAGKAADGCRKWFNNNASVAVKMDERGNPIETFSEFEHVIADVWIETWEDGELTHSGEPGWSAESSASEDSTSKPASTKKRQNSLSTASA